jgi:hypothetical protein
MPLPGRSGACFDIAMDVHEPPIARSSRRTAADH